MLNFPLTVKGEEGEAGGGRKRLLRFNSDPCCRVQTGGVWFGSPAGRTTSGFCSAQTQTWRLRWHEFAALNYSERSTLRTHTTPHLELCRQSATEGRQMIPIFCRSCCLFCFFLFIFQLTMKKSLLSLKKRTSILYLFTKQPTLI